MTERVIVTLHLPGVRTMSEYKNGRGGYYFAAAVREGRILCRCGHVKATHEDPTGGPMKCCAECDRWIADPSRRTSVGADKVERWR